MLRAFRLPPRARALGLAVALLLCAARTESATRVDPLLKFRTLGTEHFIIYFHQGKERLALRLAAIVEDVWRAVGRDLGVTSPRRTHVILADQSELASGWATPLPFNTIFVTAAAPSGSEFIGRTDDWLRVVFAHEYTHIVHMDRSEGWARVFRGLFGRTPIAFPNAWLPAWQIEGLATWEESALTSGGRLAAGDFRAIEHGAGRARRVEPVDRVNGGLTDWPAGHAPYAFGLGFHEYLATRFGAARFADLAARTSRRPPFFGAGAYRAVYGTSLGRLWRDYSTFVAEGAASRTGDATLVRLTHEGFMMSGPRFARGACSRCPREIVYSVRNPHALPSLQAISVGGSSPRRLATRYLGSTAAVGGRFVVFDQQEIRRNVGLYSDLYVLDRSSGDVRALTREARLQDPDLSSEGGVVACVRADRGRRDLVLARLATGLLESDALDAVRVETVRVLASDLDTQFSTPRWSPDGSAIVAARHRPGALSEIVLVDPGSGRLRVLASHPAARIVTPTWRPDGRAVIAAADFDGGPFNLYEFSVADSTPPRQLTATTGGAFWPDVSADGQDIVFVGYSPDGFDLFTTAYPAAPPLASVGEWPRPAVERSPPYAVAGAPRAGSYSPWPTLAPTSWAPVVVNDNHLRAGFVTGGSDVLHRHVYSASASWLVNGPDAARRPGALTPDWQLAYVYDRWRPMIFASASSDTFLSTAVPGTDGRPGAATLRERETEAGVLVPFRHIRATHRLLVSLAHSTERYLFPANQPSRARVASRLGAATSTSQEFGYSISPERGVQLGGTVETARLDGGPSSRAATVTGDVRAYLPGLADHHVVAVRLGGGMTLDRSTAGRTFLLGGSGASRDVLSFDRDAFSTMRGFPSAAFAGRRVALFNADYRWPLARPQRGYHLWPVFLNTVHAAVFTDLGHAWTDGFRARDLKTSAGAELSLNIVAGYSFPFTTSIGAAWGRDGAESTSRATVYARIGKAF